MTSYLSFMALKKHMHITFYHINWKW